MSLDGNHWYDSEGKPAYSVTMKDGRTRPTDLRDARKLGLCPSVTTFLSVIAKPQLTNWMVQQGILAALTTSRIHGESDEVFISRILHDSKEEAKKAADKGTEGHDALEKATKGLAYPESWNATVERVRALLAETFPDVTDWVAEKSFCHELGYGGKVDLHSPSTGIVVDYKSTAKECDGSVKLAYGQHWQLAAYQQGLHLRTAPCANIFFSRKTQKNLDGSETPIGDACIHVWKPDEIADGLEISMAALALWKKIRKYDPSTR